MGTLNPEGDGCLWEGVGRVPELFKTVPRLLLCLLVLNNKKPRREVQEEGMTFILSSGGGSVVEYIQCLRAWNLESDLGSNPSSTTYKLCDLGQVTSL